MTANNPQTENAIKAQRLCLATPTSKITHNIRRILKTVMVRGHRMASIFSPKAMVVVKLSPTNG